MKQFLKILLILVLFMPLSVLAEQADADPIPSNATYECDYGEFVLDIGNGGQTNIVSKKDNVRVDTIGVTKGIQSCPVLYSKKKDVYGTPMVIIDLTKTDDSTLLKPTGTLRQGGSGLATKAVSNTCLYDSGDYKLTVYTDGTFKFEILGSNKYKINEKTEPKLSEGCPKICVVSSDTGDLTDDSTKLLFNDNCTGPNVTSIPYDDRSQQSGEIKPTESGGGKTTKFDFSTISRIDCEDLKTMPETVKFLQKAFNLIKILAPILVLIYGSLDYAKVVFADKDDELKKAGQRFIKRLIAAIIIFILPALLTLIINVTGLNTTLCGIS